MSNPINEATAAMRRKHGMMGLGNGNYVGWKPGMNRRIARRIARVAGTIERSRTRKERAKEIEAARKAKAGK